MSLYGYNRSALNGGVSGIVAGAALVIASSVFAAEGTRWVYPAANPAAVSSLSASGLRKALPTGTLTVNSGVTANATRWVLPTVDTSASSGLTVNALRTALPTAELESTGELSASGTRWVLPEATPTVGSTLTAIGVRGVFGQAGFATETTGSALPGLLQLVSSDIVVTSQLKAIYTNAWALAQGELSATGIKTQNGAGLCGSAWTTTLDPLIIAGFASNIDVASSCMADASVRFSGETTWQRDGYANTVISSGFTALGLKTALGYAFAETASDCTTDSIKTHGGTARIEAACSIFAVAATDAARATSTSDMTAIPTMTCYSSAQALSDAVVTAEPTLTTWSLPVSFVGVSSWGVDGLKTRYGEGLLSGLSDTSALPTRTTYGATEPQVTTSDLTATGWTLAYGAAQIPTDVATSADPLRTALPTAELTGVSAVTAAERLALLGVVDISVASSAAATGVIYKMGEAALTGEANVAALGGLLLESSADIVATSNLSALPYTNAEAPDPAARTMYRTAVVREMRRAFTDRLMRRTA